MKSFGVLMALAVTLVGCGGGSHTVTRPDAGGTADAGFPNPEPLFIRSVRYNLNPVIDMDLLFVIDDSNGMSPLQAKMRQRIPDFMAVLQGLPGGLPNLHIGVISTSLGAGIFGNVTGCTPGSAGNLDGNFQHKAGCGLNAGETFIKSVPATGGVRTENFTGDISTVLSCVMDLGQNGCNFEHHFESTRLALDKARVQGTENYGFLRDGAYLGVVMLTNEDDCSVDPNSMLFDPNQQTTADALGGLQSYRCNEFGHKCDQSFPHTAPATPVTMTNCVSKEDGKLVTVGGFVNYLKSIKSFDQLLLAAIMGPVDPYVIESKAFMLGNGGTENQPTVRHSCTSGTTGVEFADPAVRIKQALDSFGGVIASICAPDFRDHMVRIAEVFGRAIGSTCFAGQALTRANGEPDCAVAVRSTSASGLPVDTKVPFCPPGRSGPLPCWEFAPNPAACGSNGQVINACWDAACSRAAAPTQRTDLLVSCAVEPPPAR